MEQTGHQPVLLDECIHYLTINPDGLYVDGTCGMGGHSYEIASRLKNGHLICIDKDNYALEQAAERLSEFRGHVTFIHSDFSKTSRIITEFGKGIADGMLFDLGVSSPQLDFAERGFSYMQNAPLDMRMDRTSELSAFEVVNFYSEFRLAEIFFEYGEERYARRIAAAICKERSNKPIQTTGELVEVIRQAMPAPALREKQHPAKRSFQAIRIEVNDELGSVKRMLLSAPDTLKTGGRICVISFHSLEDRIIKNGFHSRENGCTCPREAPICTCGFIQTLRVITKKPVVATDKEIKNNPRARSAKLRVAERV